jgi:hypothetical protein
MQHGEVINGGRGNDLVRLDLWFLSAIVGVKFPL